MTSFRPAACHSQIVNSSLFHAAAELTQIQLDLASDQLLQWIKKAQASRLGVFCFRPPVRRSSRCNHGGERGSCVNMCALTR